MPDEPRKSRAPARKPSQAVRGGLKRERQAAAPSRSRSTPVKQTSRRWSRQVMETSDALDLREHLFKQTSARGIALSLKRSAERSHRRKAEPFRSAMSMLNFYINRAGKNLSPERKRVLGQAKEELRKAFHRVPSH